MSTITVPVAATSTAAPGSIPVGFSGERMIVNVGAATAYVDSDQQSRPEQGIPLSAGSSIVWAAARPLWLASPAGTSVAITDAAGALFDAGAIASQIIDQGLAGDIAGQLNALGVPALNRADVLLDAGAVVPASDPWSSAVLDLSGYASYHLRAIASGGTVNGAGALNVTWASDAAMTQDLLEETFVLGDLRTLNLVRRTLNRYAVITVTLTYIHAGSDTIAVKVAASALGTVTPLYWVEGANATGLTIVDDSGLFLAVNGGLASGASNTYLPHSVAGPAIVRLYVLTAIAAGAVNLFVRDAVSGQPFLTDPGVQPRAAGWSLVHDLLLPPRPLSLQVQNTGTGVAVSYYLTLMMGSVAAVTQ